MAARFEELDWQPTPKGEISLRRRYDLVAQTEVYEVLLGDEFLMSSLFTVAERELAALALARLEGSDLQVLVGGLGLGCTAHQALADPRVGAVTVIDAVAPVIDWHRRELLPDTSGLAVDPRCQLVHGDFFQVVAAEPEGRYNAILLDIDHTPRHVLHPSHAEFYTAAGLRQLARHLVDGGVFALWSDDPPDPDFEAVLGEVFDETSATVVEFANPLTRGTSSNTIYLAGRARR